MTKQLKDEGWLVLPTEAAAETHPGKQWHAPWEHTESGREPLQSAGHEVPCMNEVFPFLTAARNTNKTSNF